MTTLVLKKFLKLMAAVDEYIPQPTRAVDEPFLMPIEDVFLNFWPWHSCNWSC